MKKKFKLDEATRHQLHHTIRMLARIFIIAVPFHATVISFVEWPYVTTIIVVGAAVHIIHWEIRRRRAARKGGHNAHSQHRS